MVNYLKFLVLALIYLATCDGRHHHRSNMERPPSPRCKPYGYIVSLTFLLTPQKYTDHRYIQIVICSAGLDQSAALDIVGRMHVMTSGADINSSTVFCSYTI